MEVIEGCTGAAFEPKPFRVRVSRAGAAPVFLAGVRGPRTVTSATDETGAALDVSRWGVEPDWDEVTPHSTVWGRLVIAGTASASATVPGRLKWAAPTLVRQWVLDLHSRVPDPATLPVQSNYG